MATARNVTVPTHVNRVNRAQQHADSRASQLRREIHIAITTTPALENNVPALQEQQDDLSSQVQLTQKHLASLNATIERKKIKAAKLQRRVI
ncbi:hypothetical protein E8E11_000232 [Didymella keratinophila]|nr:hypothetical protein E8E11_000232 [Didymella keratinophila]